MDCETRRIYDRMCLYFLMKDYPDWRPEAFAEAIGRTPRPAASISKALKSCTIMSNTPASIQRWVHW